MNEMKYLELHGDRVAYRYFFPCGRCKACLARHFKSCPVRQANWLVSCEQWPHFQRGFGQYLGVRVVQLATLRAGKQSGDNRGQ